MLEVVEHGRATEAENENLRTHNKWTLKQTLLTETTSWVGLLQWQTVENMCLTTPSNKTGTSGYFKIGATNRSATTLVRQNILCSVLTRTDWVRLKQVHCFRSRLPHCSTGGRVLWANPATRALQSPTSKHGDSTGNRYNCNYTWFSFTDALLSVPKGHQGSRRSSHFFPHFNKFLQHRDTLEHFKGVPLSTTTEQQIAKASHKPRQGLTDVRLLVSSHYIANSRRVFIYTEGFNRDCTSIPFPRTRMAARGPLHIDLFWEWTCRYRWPLKPERALLLQYPQRQPRWFNELEIPNTIVWPQACTPICAGLNC